MEIFADNNISSRLRPVGRHFHVVLFEDDGAFIVSDGGGAQLPRNFIVGSSPSFELLGEDVVSLAALKRETNSSILPLVRATLGYAIYFSWIKLVSGWPAQRAAWGPLIPLSQTKLAFCG